MRSRLSHVCPASALGNGRHLDGCHDELCPAWVGASACSAARVHIHHAAHSALMVSPGHWQHRPRRAGCARPGGLRGPARCSNAAPLPCGRGRACIGTPWLLLARPEEQLTCGELCVQVERSVVAFNKMVAAHEVGTLVYTAYGKDWVRSTPTALTAPACLTLGLCGRGMLAQVKKQNMSPDAYAQMAIQLAYYRCAAREVVAVAIAPESTIHDRRPVVRFTACTAMSRRRTSQPTLASSCGGGRNASGRRLCRARRGWKRCAAPTQRYEQRHSNVPRSLHCMTVPLARVDAGRGACRAATCRHRPAWSHQQAVFQWSWHRSALARCG